MQPLEIKALELKATVLKSLDEFIHEHALAFFVVAIYLLLALLVWVLCGGLRRKFPNQSNICAGIGIVIQPHTPPLPPPPIILNEYDPPDCDGDNYWE